MLRLITVVFLWVLWSRARLHRATRMQTARQVREESSLQRLDELVLHRADVQWESHLSDADAIDAKAGNLAAADLAALTIVIAAHQTIGYYWWVPASLMAAAAVLFYGVLRTQEWDIGPDLPTFRREQAGRSPSQMTEEMISDVLFAMDVNDLKIKHKARMFRWGYRLLGAALISAAVVAAFAQKQLW